MATTKDPVNEVDMPIIPETEVLIRHNLGEVPAYANIAPAPLQCAPASNGVTHANAAPAPLQHAPVSNGVTYANAAPAPLQHAPASNGVTYANTSPAPLQYPPAPDLQTKDSKTSGCPKGLEYLVPINQLFVKQQIEMLEVISMWESNNKYNILTTQGDMLYTCIEDTNCCARNCCGSYRKFKMNVKDRFQNNVLKFKRPYRCNATCFCCLGCLCGQVINVFLNDGTLIGCVRQDAFFGCSPRYTVYDHNNEPQLKIRGPVCFCCTVEFKVYPYRSGEEIGRISKKWAGAVKSFFSDADTFGVSFPLDLDVRMKACLLGGVMLLDFMYFEDDDVQA